MDIKKSSVLGFVLVDVLIGVIILMVALLAIGGLYLQSSHSVAFADNRTVAMHWAKARIEELRATGLGEADGGWRGLSGGGNDPVVPPDAGNVTPPRTGYYRETTVVLANVTESDLVNLPLNTTKSYKDIISAANDQLVLVTVTVRWSEKGVEQTVQLRTYIERD